MTYVTLPHVGAYNIDTIRAVRWAQARWRHKEDRRVYRQWLFWGKPMRSNGASFGAWLEHAEVRVFVVGSEYPLCISFPNDKRAQQACQDIEQAIQAARDVGPERIVAAAIVRVEIDRALSMHDERVWVSMTYSMPSPARHHHILHAMPTTYEAGPVGPHEQGFLTSTGRFVKRKEAMGIAVAAGQVAASKVTAPDLFSEDLW